MSVPAELKLKGRKAALDDADAAEQKLGRELDAARQRGVLTERAGKNMDGYQNSVKTVMRAAGARRLRHHRAGVVDLERRAGAGSRH